MSGTSSRTGLGHVGNALVLPLITALSGCSGSGPSDAERDLARFRVVMSNGPELAERSTAWVCSSDRSTRGTTVGLPASDEVALRFFDDGQMLVGFGPDEEEARRWRLLESTDPASTTPLVELTASPRWMPASDVGERTPGLFARPVTSGSLSSTYTRTYLGLAIGWPRSPEVLRRIGQWSVIEVLECTLFDRDGESMSREGEYSPVFDPLGRDLPTSEDGSVDEEATVPDDDVTVGPDEEGGDDEGGDDEDAGGGGTPVATSEEPSTSAPGSGTEAPGDDSRPLGELQDDIEAIWYAGDLGDVVSVVNGLSSAFYPVIELEDGSATTDATFLSDNGANASRRAHPERWGEARVQGGVFGFKLEGERSWREPEFAVRTESRRRGATLAGCFRSSSGRIAGPVASVSFRSVCFDADGRFAFDGVTSTSGSGGGTVASNARGEYLIDERAIRLAFDDGERRNRLFGVYLENGFVEAIVLGSRVLDADG